MKTFAEISGLVILVIVLVLGLTWITEGNNFFLYKFFAPKEEAVRRQVFEESKAYRQGMVQNLQNRQFDYLQADTNHQTALGALILHDYGDYDETKLPMNLRHFIEELRNKSVNQ